MLLGQLLRTVYLYTYVIIEKAYFTAVCVYTYIYTSSSSLPCCVYVFLFLRSSGLARTSLVLFSNFRPGVFSSSIF